jgi:hypothetical protein
MMSNSVRKWLVVVVGYFIFADTIDVVMPLDAPALIFCDAAFVAHLQQVGATSETPIGVVPCADWTRGCHTRNADHLAIPRLRE